MNVANLAKTAYSTSSQAPIRSNRGTEYEAFARITHQIGAAIRRGTTGFASLAEALHENRKLWSLLAADVAGDGNSLPPDLRARIFYLAEFTADHSRNVLSNGADAEILIDINTAIMRGLRQRTEAV